MIWSRCACNIIAPIINLFINGKYYPVYSLKWIVYFKGTLSSYLEFFNICL